MPTAAKLIAALCFGAVLAFVSMLAMPLFEGHFTPRWFTYVNVAIGALVGWQVFGPRAGQGWVAGISYGLTSMVVTVFWTLFAHGAARMIELSMQNRYDGPLEAVVAGFGLSIELGQLLATPQIILSLLIGALLSGLFVEAVGQRTN